MIASTPVTLAKLMLAVSKVTGVSSEDIKGPSTTRTLSTARMAFSYLARTHGYSYQQIGKVTKRDHSSIIAQVKTATDRITDRDFMDLLEKVDAVLIDSPGAATLQDTLARVRALREALEIEVSLLRDLENG